MPNKSDEIIENTSTEIEILEIDDAALDCVCGAGGDDTTVGVSVSVSNNSGSSSSSSSTNSNSASASGGSINVCPFIPGPVLRK